MSAPARKEIALIESVAPDPQAVATRAADRAMLTALVQFTADAAETGTNIGWITHDVREVAESTARIVTSVDKLAGTIAELSTSSATTAEETEALRRDAQACESEMQSAGDSMRLVRSGVSQMSERLSVLEGAVTQIADMAKTIEAISKQTNLLALNATIEAARAGEAGRGFAVVAGEVKSLSAQTAQATDQIRTRIATLTAEMNEIKQAIHESDARVETGEATVTRAGAQIGAIGSRIETITQRMAALVDVLGEQRAATDEISASGTKIAEKAKKTRKEIAGSLDRLIKAESAGREAVDAAASQHGDTGELRRAKADLTVWKRKLAATLVGLAKPDAALVAAENRRLARWCEGVADPVLRNRPAFAALAAAESKALGDAQRLLDAVRGSNWKAATDAYMAAETAIQDAIAQADTLIDSMTDA